MEEDGVGVDVDLLCCPSRSEDVRETLTGACVEFKQRCLVDISWWQRWRCFLFAFGHAWVKCVVDGMEPPESDMFLCGGLQPSFLKLTELWRVLPYVCDYCKELQIRH